MEFFFPVAEGLPSLLPCLPLSELWEQNVEEPLCTRCVVSPVNVRGCPPAPEHCV